MKSTAIYEAPLLTEKCRLRRFKRRSRNNRRDYQKQPRAPGQLCIGGTLKFILSVQHEAA
jgi:hypothetical protein